MSWEAGMIWCSSGHAYGAAAIHCWPQLTIAVQPYYSPSTPDNCFHLKWAQKPTVNGQNNALKQFHCITWVLTVISEVLPHVSDRSLTSWTRPSTSTRHIISCRFLGSFTPSVTTIPTPSLVASSPSTVSAASKVSLQSADDHAIIRRNYRHHWSDKWDMKPRSRKCLLTTWKFLFYGTIYTL